MARGASLVVVMPMSDSMVVSCDDAPASLDPQVVARWRALGLGDDGAFERTFVSTLETSQLASALTGVSEILACVEAVVGSATVVSRPGEAPGEAGQDDASAALPALEVLGLACGAVLGTGGMSVVREAHQHVLGREVAVKIPRTDAERAPLLREAWASGALEHPNIIPVHHLARTDDGRPALVMKRVSGTCWGDLLADLAHPALAAVPDRLGYHLGVLMQVCNAVHFAHSRGIVHRDVKPDNVMLGDFGEVYLMDWGIAVATDERHRGRLILASDITDPGGTPCYMAPEMIDPSLGRLGAHSDVYLLGATLHEVLTGAPPHRGATLVAVLQSALRGAPRTYADDISPELAAVARRAMALDPAERFADAEAMRRALLEVLRHQASRELGQEAAARLGQLTALLEGAEPPPVARVQRLYSEARFACEQALRTWPGNPHAARTRHRLLVRMARHELALGNLASAERLVAELEHPPPELLAELTARRDASRDAASELAALRRDADLSLAAKARARVFIALTALIAVMNGVITWGFGLGVDARSAAANVAPPVVVFAVLGVTLWLGRRLLLRTRIDRQLFGALLALIAGAVVMRVIDTAQGRTMAETLVHQHVLATVGSAVLAVTVDRFFAWACAIFLVGLGLVVALPAWSLLTTPIVLILAFSVSGVGWLRLDRRTRDG